MRPEIDLSYSKDFLKKINTLVVKDKNISEYFYYRDVNFWHFYQQDIFQDIKDFSGRGFSTDIKKQNMVNAFLSGIVLNFLSLISIILTIIKKQKVFIYGIDKWSPKFGADNRLRDLYQMLSDQKIEYREILHSVSGRTMRINLRMRKRLSIYVEGVDYLWRGMKLCGLVNSDESFIAKIDNYGVFESEEEKTYAKRILKKYWELFQISKLKVRLYEEFFRIAKPNALFLIDDGRRYFFELVLGAKLARIKTVAIQHGHISKYQVGWLNNGITKKYITPDKYLLWSNYWINELIAFNTFLKKETLVNAGSPSRSGPPTSSKGRGDVINGDRKYILVPYEATGPKSEVAKFILKLSQCKKFDLIFKLRPDKTREAQMSEYGFTTNGDYPFRVTFDMLPYLKANVVAIGVYSTILYDLIGENVPVAVIKTSSDYGEGLVRNNLASEIEMNEAICENVDNLFNTPKEELQKRKQVLYGNNGKLLYDTLTDIAHEYDLISEKN